VTSNLSYSDWFDSHATVFRKVNKELSVHLANAYQAKIKECYLNSFHGMYYEAQSLDYYEGFVDFAKNSGVRVKPI